MTWEELAREYVRLAAPILAPILAAIVGALLLRLVNSNRENARYLGVAIALLRASLGDKLQGKADAVLEAWNAAVKDAMSDKPATQNQALDKFMHSIKEQCTLTPQEEDAVRSVAARTFVNEDKSATVGALSHSPGGTRVKMLSLGK